MKLLLALATSVLALGACKSSDPTPKQIRDWVDTAGKTKPAGTIEPIVAQHVGPQVATGTSGPARFARTIYTGFDAERALDTAKFVDGFWREPGNEGFDAVIERLRGELSALGFGTQPGFELTCIETPQKRDAWTPVSGRLWLTFDRGDAEFEVLHRFDAPGDRDRLLLPAHAPATNVNGPVALELGSLHAGDILVVEQGLSVDLVESAHAKGAVAVLSAHLAHYNVDPTGGGRERDAIHYTSAPDPCPLPVAQISPRSLERIRAAAKSDLRARLHLDGEVRTRSAPLKTLIATIVGAKQSGEAVAIAAHVQEPGACDNASGVATLLEAVRDTKAAIDEGRIEPPARSLCFVFGLEMEESRILCDKIPRHFFAAIAADMEGESRERTGAMPLLERSPDPGALELLPPDVHTPWGAAQVKASDVKPSGVALVVRTALVDTALVAGGWETSEHPYEGGSDHEVYLGRGIPAVLLWHFTDFTYHTSLDRIENVDAAEMRRCGTVLLSAALALADARPSDLERYLASLKLEQDLRTKAAHDLQKSATEERWIDWCKGARMWLRELCLGTEPPIKPKTKKE